jgi:hypothetical protein
MIKFKVIHVKNVKSDSYKMGALERRVGKFLAGISKDNLIKISFCDCHECGPVAFITYNE